MLEFLESVYTRLSSSSTLLAVVDIENISTTYKKSMAEVPSVVFAITNVRTAPLSGISSVVLSLDVRGRVSNLDTWNIATIVKELLHEKPIETSSVTCLIHIIDEIDVVSNYDNALGCWVVGSKYNVIFSNADILVTSGAVGQIYADSTNVHVHSDHLIADFDGMISVYLDYESITHEGLHRFKDSSQFHKGNGNIYVTNVQFKFSSLSQLWNITYNASDVLNDGVTSSTSYLIKQTSYPKELQLLFHGTKTDNGKEFEIYAPKVILPVITVPFSRHEISILDFRFVLLSDANENLCKLTVEN